MGFEFAAWWWWRWKWFVNHYCGPMSLCQRTDWVKGQEVKIITATLHRDNLFFLTSIYIVLACEQWRGKCHCPSFKVIYIFKKQCDNQSTTKKACLNLNLIYGDLPTRLHTGTTECWSGFQLEILLPSFTCTAGSPIFQSEKKRGHKLSVCLSLQIGDM